METVQETGLRCPICGCGTFVDFRSRKATACGDCGSLPRTRMAWAMLTRHVRPQPDWRVLHLAPERQLAKVFIETCNDGYDPTDFSPGHYARKIGRPVRKLDLVAEAAALPSNHYDLVVHNHVMEHIPCNVTLLIQHLHRSIKPGGIHLFSIPIWPGTSREDLDLSLPEPERIKIFGHKQHMRRFGRDDFDVTTGPILGVTSAYTMENWFSADELREWNIPEDQWRCSGSSVFLVRKT